MQDVALGDFLEFRLRDRAERPLGRASLRLRFDATFDAKPLPPITIDLVVGQAGYRAEAARVAGLDEYRTLERTAVLAHALLDPQFAAAIAGSRWVPGRSAWLPG